MYFPGLLRVFALPSIPHISKKRAVLSFIFYALLSAFRKKAKPVPAIADSASTGSGVWDRYKEYLDLYVRYLAPRYLLSAYIVRYVAGGYAHQNYAPGGRGVPTAETTSRLAESTRQALQQVSAGLADKFSTVEEETAFNWLSTYQLAPLELGFSAEETTDLFRDHLIVELGPGVGANALVHACLSNEGVLAFDLPEMRNVQEAIFREVSDVLPSAKITCVSDLEELLRLCSGRRYLVISHWAFTEFPIDLRKRVEPLIENSRLSLFACNAQFEGIDNLSYFESAVAGMQDKSLRSVPIRWQTLKGHHYVAIE